MTRIGPTGLFGVSGMAHCVLIVFTVSRLFVKPALAAEEKGTFQAAPLARTMTPETLAMIDPAEDQEG